MLLKNTIFLFCSYIYFLLELTAADSKADECTNCKFLVKTFLMGMKKTEKQHFAGGNTDWEERKLGKFATSETRFVEIMEYTCKKDTLSDSTEFDVVKEIKFKCHSLAEEHEETLEKWFFSHQNTHPGLEKWLCIDELKKCCPSGHFGPLCQPCQGVQKSQTACFGRGRCQGDGTRGGSGKCECDRGYVGIMCSNCDAHFFEKEKNDSFIECEECFDGCASGCTSSGPKGCRVCRTGYIMDADEGCKDVDECAENDKCTKEHEKCVNNVGSYNCVCEDGYRRNSRNECELDIEAPDVLPSFGPESLLRSVAFAGISGIVIFVMIWQRSILLLFLTLCALIAMILIERNERSLLEFFQKAFR